MESRNCLGIYLRKDRATVVCFTSQGRENRLRGCFSVSVDATEQQGQQALADRIAQVCAERGLKSATAAVALDCALFMQHTVHSDFCDFKKIATTVRFDTEEALATDVSDLAVAFRIASTDENGAHLDVFTAQRSVLSDILLSLQSNGIDPVAVVPDVYSLSRYINEGQTSLEAGRAAAVHALLSDSRGYFLGTPSSNGGPMMRAFLIGPSQDREALLSREAVITVALAGRDNPVEKLCVFDVCGGITARELSQRVSVKVDECDLAGMRGLSAGDGADSSNAVDFAIAYGAALPESEKDKGISFRNDHMPYLGKKVRLQRAVRFLSISLTVLLLAAGVYAQTQFMSVKRYQTMLREKLEPDYLAVMPGVEKLPSTMKEVVQKLRSDLRRLEAERGGQVDPKSLSAKMKLVLQALNTCAAQADLNLDVVTLTAQSITVNGDTSGRPSTLKVFDSMEKAGLTLQKTGYIQKGRRDTFTITMEPKKTIE